MPTNLISPAERDYILKGVEANVRADGRQRGDYREVSIETGIISQTSGSARVKIAGGTDMLVSVRAEIGPVLVDSDTGDGADKGQIICSVECVPSASQGWEGRGADDVNNELSQIMARILSSGNAMVDSTSTDASSPSATSKPSSTPSSKGGAAGIDLSKLCIIPGRLCWILYIDALILDYGGNIIDALLMGTRAAIFDTQIPKTQLQEFGDGQFDFELQDDTEDMVTIEGRENMPICVTLNKIGARYIVDASPLEELVTEARLTIAVNKYGQVCGLQKSQEGCMEPSLLLEMIQSGKTMGQALIKQLDAKIEAEAATDLSMRMQGKPPQKYGFFAQ
ncbi:Exosome complex component RRP42 [Actinomortierella ambigua]|nr:Exosome complex component RRP42 [Actinomortierella ambigua]